MVNAENKSDLQSCHTGRLLLCRPSEDHLHVVAEIHGDPETNFFNPSGSTSVEESTSLLSAWLSHWHDHGFGYWSVSTLQQPDQIIGFGGVTLKHIDETEVLNLYFRFSLKAWGKCYATELGHAAIRTALHLLDFDEMRAVVRPNNLPSRSVLERVGLRQIGRIKDIPEQESSLIYRISRL